MSLFENIPSGLCVWPFHVSHNNHLARTLRTHIFLSTDGADYTHSHESSKWEFKYEFHYLLIEQRAKKYIFVIAKSIAIRYWVNKTFDNFVVSSFLMKTLT